MLLRQLLLYSEQFGKLELTLGKEKVIDFLIVLRSYRAQITNGSSRWRKTVKESVQQLRRVSSHGLYNNGSSSLKKV